MKGGVYVSVNISALGSDIAVQIISRVTANITNNARRRVRVSTEATVPGGPHGTLRNSIQKIGVNRMSWIVVAETPYAAVQEWGHPLYPRYGYTPYMTPAAQEETTDAALSKICDEVAGDLAAKAQFKALYG